MQYVVTNVTLHFYLHTKIYANQKYLRVVGTSLVYKEIECYIEISWGQKFLRLLFGDMWWSDDVGELTRHLLFNLSKDGCQSYGNLHTDDVISPDEGETHSRCLETSVLKTKSVVLEMSSLLLLFPISCDDKLPGSCNLKENLLWLTV